MKWLNQISIKVKVMLPICILGIVILLASISSLVNSKRLLQAGVVISQDCSKSIELLMDMSSELESMGKNMYGHCDAENSISKESFATTIHEKLESMDSYFKQYKKQKKTAREKEYFGALQNRFKKYKEGMEQVLTASSKGDADGATEAINVIQKPSEDYLAKKISSLIAMRKQAMNDSLQAQQAAYEFSRDSAIVFVAVSMLMILFSLWICLRGIVGPMNYISHTLQKMVADIEKNQGDLSVRLKISGKDEIGKVGRNVNAFIDTLQNVMGRITDSSLRMNQIIREVDDKVRSSNENSDDISTAMEELSASMISVADMVSGITKNMKEVEDRTKELSEKSGAVPDGGFIEAHTDLVQKLDYECELAVVLGKDAKDVPAGQTKDYVFGYTILNDVSARDVQTAHKQWYFGKSLDGFTPMGPCIVTADEFDTYPPALPIRSRVNGELRQDSNTKLQIFDIDHVIHELSQGMTLKAGTIIATGTPAGVGMGMDPPQFLHPGDTVQCEIEGIGTLTNTVR